jgi:hypothetical protein
VAAENLHLSLIHFLPQSAVFALHRRNYAAAAGARVMSDDPRVSETVHQLDEDGVVVIPGFWNRERALELGARMEAAAVALERDEHAVAPAFDGDKKIQRFYWEPATRLIRVMRPEMLDASSQAFYDDAFIWSVAKSYTCENIVSWQRMYESRAGLPIWGAADNWHIDEAFYFKFKAFLYLSDVSAETALYMYLKGSHRPAPCRATKTRQILSHDIYGLASEHGVRGNHVDEREFGYLKKTYGDEEVACVGPAGSLLLIDTDGLHKATTPNSSGCRMLSQYFELPRAVIWPPTFKNG